MYKNIQKIYLVAFSGKAIKVIKGAKVKVNIVSVNTLTSNLCVFFIKQFNRAYGLEIQGFYRTMFNK
jgi:multisubunit Na+/H+ antiporter MnhF subunit